MAPKSEPLWALVAVLLLATLAFVPRLVGQGRFHPDEALYMTFARDAAVGGNWLLAGELDKPPLTIYVNALSLSAWGVHTLPDGVLDLNPYRGEFAGRLPNVWAALLLVALVMRLARDMGGTHRAAFLAGVLSALSPYIIAFSATAFTDMQMTLWGTAALWGAHRRRPAWSGLALALAIASKPQGLFYAPLTVALLWARGAWGWRDLTRWAAPLIGGALLLALWQTARGGVDVWTLARAHYITPGLATPAEAQERLAAWLGYLEFLMANAPATALLIALTPLLWRRAARHSANISARMITLWMLAYTLFHIGVTVNIYDRYLLPLAPLLALVGALAMTPLIRDARARSALALWLIISVGPIGVGGDRGQHDGIDQLAAHLNAKPVATVVYDTWLGWELGYYMGQWHDKRRVHYPTPVALRAGALALAEQGPRYWVAPRTIDAEPWLAPLRAEGFGVRLEWMNARFVVYRLQPPSFNARRGLGL